MAVQRPSCRAGRLRRVANGTVRQWEWQRQHRFWQWQREWQRQRRVGNGNGNGNDNAGSDNGNRNGNNNSGSGFGNDLGNGQAGSGLGNDMENGVDPLNPGPSDPTKDYSRASSRSVPSAHDGANAPWEALWQELMGRTTLPPSVMMPPEQPAEFPLLNVRRSPSMGRLATNGLRAPALRPIQCGGGLSRSTDEPARPRTRHSSPLL